MTIIISIYGDLNGYKSYNISQSLKNRVQRLLQGNNNVEQEVAEKISHVFCFILNIYTNDAIFLYGGDSLENTRYFYRGRKRVGFYTYLANKLIPRYPEERFPELSHLLQRVIDERQGIGPHPFDLWKSITTNECRICKKNQQENDLTTEFD